MDSFGLGKSNESRVHQFTLPRGDIVISPHFSDASRDEADRFLLESL